MPASYVLPDKPLVVIERSAPWASMNFRGLWNYRELFYFLVWRDLKVRYRQTVLGATWAILQPLLTMVIFTYFFGRLVKVPSDGIPYPIFAYAGLVTWSFFSSAVSLSSNSLLANSGVIAKVYFPRIIIPAAAVSATLVDFGITLVLLAPLMLYYGYALSWSFVLLPFLIVLTALCALAVGMLISALAVRYRDALHATPFLIQVWFFMSPVIYPSSLVPPSHRWLMELNPLTGIIEGFRAVLFGRPINWSPLMFSIAFPTILLIYAAHRFRKAERTFAEFM